ncbi:dual specificity phosphatase 28 [Siniperca chuatsi]|nr:dual specificity phosphatase 28 [Siniperca chuatsi]XP_044075709.1 dual specificity phosphatase 28 [Siniperca chuatsi]XP_044075711.1 dual specificity phosphatase 28 [Siniperca chuatsi]
MLQLCKVTKALFISNARSACSDELIQQEAVTLCINVSKQQPFPSADVKKLQIPVYDDPGEDLYSHFDRCADAIQKEANRGGRSVVYCKNGRSRSATVCIAYLMKHRKLALPDAVQKVKTARHVIDPNSGFLSQLQRYEQELKKRRGETAGRLSDRPQTKT